MKVTTAHRGILKNFAVLLAVNAVFQFCSSSPLSEETTKIIETPELISNKTVLPPLIFPSDTTVYRIVTGNETALKILQNAEQASTEASSKDPPKTEAATSKETTTEKVTESSTLSENSSTTEAAKKSTSSDEDDYEYSEEKDDKESDVEEIQTTKQKPEDGLEENFGNHDAGDSMKIDDSVVDAPIFHNGHFAGMFAGLLVVLSVACYIGLVLWRSRLEKKYGMRERLVTEDDYYHNNDSRYFGL